MPPIAAARTQPPPAFRGRGRLRRFFVSPMASDLFTLRDPFTFYSPLAARVAALSWFDGTGAAPLSRKPSKRDAACSRIGRTPSMVLPAPASRVRARPLTAGDREQAIACLTRNFPERDEAYWRQGWRRLAEHMQPPDRQPFGYGLEADGA